MSTRGPRDTRSRLYGRRKGHALSARQQHLLDRLLPRIAIDADATPPASPAALFAHDPRHIVLEIGFGAGEHLAAGAATHPDWGFIGAEAYVNGLAAMLGEIEARDLANVRLFDGDGEKLLAWLPAASLDRVDLLYLDPWPKRRHWKRRFVRAETLDAIHRVLKPGAALRFASDWPDYVTWTLMHALAHEGLRWTARTADDWRRPWPGWPGTRYEAKALREGRAPSYLTFRRPLV